jgi:hypothetical protein
MTHASPATICSDAERLQIAGSDGVTEAVESDIGSLSPMTAVARTISQPPMSSAYLS